MKIIPFYREVSEYSVTDFFESLNSLSEHEVRKSVIRINTPGGDVDAGWGWISGFVDFAAEFEYDIKCKVDGLAGSFGAYFLLFVEAECIPQSRFVIHRASYPSWIELTEERKASLKKANKFFKDAFVSRIDVEKFEKISGVTVDRLFDDSQEVIDVELNAKQAKAIKLVKKIVPLNPIEASTIKSMIMSAHSNIQDLDLDTVVEENENEETITIMDINILKEKHPGVYAEVAKIESEKESGRVQAWMKFFDFDPEAVKAGIESGKEISMSDISAFYASQLKDEVIKASVDGNAGETDGKEKPLVTEEKETESKEIASFKAQVENLIKAK